MRVMMKVTKRGKESNFPVREYTKGETYDILDESLAKVFVSNGWAVAEKSVAKAPENKMIEAAPENKEDDLFGEEEEVELSSLSIPQLREFAEDHDIDLGKLTKKAEIIEAIEAALESDADGETDEG